MLPELRISYQSCSPRSLPSAGTFLVRVPALGAALGGERGEPSLIGYPERGASQRMMLAARQERGERGECSLANFPKIQSCLF